MRPYFHDAQPDARPVSTGLKNLRGKVLFGSFFHTPRLGEVECLHEALVELDAAGRITAVVKSVDPAYEAKKKAFEAEGRLVALHGFILPGFVDLHVHAPQLPQLGKALDAAAEVWLQQYTFPLESRYADSGSPNRVSSLVANLLANGATTAVYFRDDPHWSDQGSWSISASNGSRALIGRWRWTIRRMSGFLSRRLDGSRLAATEEPRVHSVVQEIAARASLSRCNAAVLPSCTDGPAGAAGPGGARDRLPLQTHCSESDWQHHTSSSVSADRHRRAGFLRPAVPAHGAGARRLLSAIADHASPRAAGPGCPLRAVEHVLLRCRLPVAPRARQGREAGARHGYFWRAEPVDPRQYPYDHSRLTPA